MIFFFFSSRRRHTRWTGDWSSDVCSSDLWKASRMTQAIPLHTARVIRDAFHRAIKWADDFANGKRGEKSFELHEDWPFLCHGFNGAKDWLRQLAPPGWPCESPHAAQDRDNAPPFRRCVKKLGRRPSRRNSTPVLFGHHPTPRIRQIADSPPADNRKRKQP